MTPSPYELLRAVRPQPPHSVVTPYDLYSQIQQSAPLPKPEALLPVSQPEHPALAAASPFAIRKTHYISDIHAKHSTACRCASFISQPIREDFPPSVR